MFLSYQLQMAYQAKTINGRSVFIFRAGKGFHTKAFKPNVTFSFVTLGRWDPGKCTLDDIFRCNVYCLQRLVSERGAQTKGIEAIVDLKDLDLSHVRHFTPSHAKKIADLLMVRSTWLFNSAHRLT